MKIGTEHKKEKCPKCGSKEILTLGMDQMCCDCDWDNSHWLVDLGQLDNIFEAVRQQFGNDVDFDARHENENTIDLECVGEDMPSNTQRIA
ncbi:MAG: hypothetical protein IPM97_16320 [Bdellovibrionaceae bacterium]|nr:hypothetical protein [Pseudobdellovibrionaceae bacterium]OYZ18365.1 MAG: hypothetical protein B7Y39_13665 [Bdellovibrio sp. 28-41-41]